MDLECYRNFLAIVEASSFTGAAECVHIAQPALSKQLRNLENYFGAKLIISNRGSRQLFLTEAGRAFYQKAKYICSLDDLAKAEINSIMGGVRGTLRFSITSSRSALFIKTSLKNFSQLYPKITCELYEASVEEQTQQLLNGITELGVLSTPLRHQENFQVLFRRDEELVAVVHKDSIWLDNDKDTINLQELEDVPLSLSGGCATLFKNACEEYSLVPNIICISTSRQSALQWVAEKAAVGILPIEPTEDLGPEYITKRIFDINTDLYKIVVKVKDRPLSVAAQHFLKFYAKTRNSQQVCDLDKVLRN